MDVNDARKLRAPEDENRRLKQLVADLSLDKEALTTQERLAAPQLKPKRLRGLAPINPLLTRPNKECLSISLRCAGEWWRAARADGCGQLYARVSDDRSQ